MIFLDITSFLGRFHPVFVHLPIGFILIAILVEWWLKEEKFTSAVRFIWLLGAISAGIAAVMGWFLANDGSYDNWTLFFHRWLGIALAIIALAAWWIRGRNTTKFNYKKITNITAILVLIITGHLGGNMTHGSDYLLEYAPAPIQKLMGYGRSLEAYPQFDNPDSVHVYKDIIYPILEKKCINCHREDVQNGGLNMTSIESISKGGDNGEVLVPGDISSELLRRVTLPTSSSKFMPTSGTPMTYHEIKLLEWWINEGANYEVSITSLNANASIQSTLLNLFKLDLTPRPWIEKKVVAPLDSVISANITGTGLKVMRLAQNNGWVEVSVPFGEKVNSTQLEKLKEASHNITWLNLANSNLTDSDLEHLVDLPHITRLRLQGNDITTDGIRQLTQMKYLESLNLTKTKVGDDIFQILPVFPALKYVYLWESNVTDSAVITAREQLPGVQIEIGTALKINQ